MLRKSRQVSRLRCIDMGSDDRAFEASLKVLEGRIGYEFENKELLITALTHSSYAGEHEVDSYERLEFLGDTVLEMVVTAEIYERLGDATEGLMTRARGGIVDGATLSSVARTSGLSEAMRLGIGEERNGGRDRSSIQADVVEAVIAAVYLDGGIDSAFDVVGRLMRDSIEARLETLDVVDSRSALQERLGKDGRMLTFTFEQTGPDHDPQFVATAYVDEVAAGNGSGPSKKAAAIDASRVTLESFEF